MICIAFLFSISSFNYSHPPDCTPCSASALSVFILANSVSTQYEFRCGGGTNCLLGSITTLSTNKKIVICTQSEFCVTLGNTSGNSNTCLSFTKGQTYYVHRVGSTGHWLEFTFKTNATIPLADGFIQESNDFWTEVSPGVSLSSWNTNPPFLPKCFVFQTCTQCN